MTSFRSVLERAMRELQADFTEIVERRLRALMDDDAPVARVPAKASATTRGQRAKAGAKVATKTRAATTTKKKKTVAAAKPARGVRRGRPTASRARPSTTAIATALLDALANGGELSRGALMKAAGLDAREGERVFQALAALRRSGQITMTGTRRSATYRFAQTGTVAEPTEESSS